MILSQDIIAFILRQLIHSTEFLSTYGSLSPGGVHGLNRFKTEYGWKKVGERIVHDTKGNEITIPVL